MRNFKELKIWQKGFQLAINCFKIRQHFLHRKNLASYHKSTEPEYPFFQT